MAFYYKGHVKCVSLKNRYHQTRPSNANITSDKSLFYPFIVSVNESGGSGNSIDDPYARVCVPKKAKNLNLKVFNLMSGVNETTYLVQHELCEYKCGLNKNKYISKPKWNHNECKCGCK